MDKMNKIEQAKQLLAKHCHLLKCPYCGTALRPNDAYSLVCMNRHTFDLSRTGYVHLLPNRVRPSKYTRTLFEARQAISRAGFFDSLIEQIDESGRKFIPLHDRKLVHVLDAGCGEGSHLAHLIERWRANGKGERLGVGLDISKDGILLASSTYPGMIWCVGDVSNCPFRDEQFQVILNFFSPANYAEMNRLLHQDGILIKVVPGRDYLSELRSVLGGRLKRKSYSNDYSNDQIIARFCNQFKLMDLRQVRYAWKLPSPDWLKTLLHMTPLSWGESDIDEQELRKANITSVTVDAVILIGKKEIS